MKGMVALDANTGAGLILSDGPVDTEGGIAWIGISLQPGTIGKFWRSKSPKLQYKAFCPKRCAERHDSE